MVLKFIFFILIFTLINLIFIPKKNVNLIQAAALVPSLIVSILSYFLIILFHFYSFLPDQYSTDIFYKSDVIDFVLIFSFNKLYVYLFYLITILSYVCITFFCDHDNLKAFAISILFFELLLLLSISIQYVHLVIYFSYGLFY